MPTCRLRATQDSCDRVLAQIQDERGTWSAWLVPTPADWRMWLTQGGLSVMSLGWLCGWLRVHRIGGLRLDSRHAHMLRTRLGELRMFANANH
jgi:hypothetical protein